ncbi:hypothetical protein LZ554_002321 [Drepanopeziza brunnea f. sp. 'monogermtubi']|nr:hypothetical protein LZ554_002321 [Drepanopeziza brunnea f. sp. 'monogermtubi']
MSPPFGGRRYAPVKDMSKEQMDQAVASLRAIYNNSPEDEIREAIHATDGDLDAAAGMLFLYGEPIEQAHASASEEEAAARGSVVDVDKKKAADEAFLGTITEEAQRSGVRKLLEIFPNREASQVQQALRRRNYEFTEAAEDLADLSPSPSSPEPPCSRLKLKVRFTNRAAGSNGAPPPTSSSPPSSSAGVPHLSNHECPSSESGSPTFTPRTTASVSPQTGSAALPLRYADWGFGELGRLRTPENKRTDDEMAHEVVGSSTPKTKREARDPPASRPGKRDHYYIILDSDDADDVDVDVDMDSLLDRPVTKEASPATSHESGGEEIDVDALLAGVTAAGGDNAMIDSDQNLGNRISSKEPAPEGEGSLGSVSWDDKVEHLMTVCPTAGRSKCAVELQLADGNVEEAFRELEGEFGVGGEMCEESADDEDDESEESDDDDEGEISIARVKRPASLKRRARPSKQSRPQKRRHRAGEETAAALEGRKIKSTEEEEEDDDDDDDDDDEAEGLEPASQWVQSTIHADDGLTILLDTGIHACKIPRKILRKLPALKEEAESIDDDGSLQVPHVSQHTFDLALQWAVCKNGRLEEAQRKDRAAEVGAYVDLAVFASRVGLGLGSSQSSPLLARLRAVLASDRDALRGTHIREAYTRLGEGHRVRKLLLQASVKPYAQFKHQDPADDDGDDSEDVSAEEEALALNSAQRASYLKDRFRFGAEMRAIQAYRYDLMEEFQRVWWRRTSHEVRYSRTAHWCTRTELTDPLSNEQFFIS